MSLMDEIDAREGVGGGLTGLRRLGPTRYDKSRWIQTLCHKYGRHVFSVIAQFSSAKSIPFFSHQMLPFFSSPEI